VPEGNVTTVNAWLKRMQEASQYRSYTGTFVVSASGNLSSARIWHVCEQGQQIERIEPLNGTPRATFRHNDQVVTFFPESRVAVAETRESAGLFLGMLNTHDLSIGDYYHLKLLGSARIAGFDADVISLLPLDSLRYGYRIWSEKRTGLVVQLQTLNLDGRVIEQAAFSELHLDAPVNVAKLHQLMGNTEGYQLEHVDVQKVAPEAQSWTLRKSISGFRPVAFYRRPVVDQQVSAQPREATLQWTFSDGLANVSLFVETFDRQRHGRNSVTEMEGATHTLSKRFGAWWVTAVGEVPQATLVAFIQALERKK
jgi:sigma-E factor negative regulatory protein RseB